MAFKWRYLRFDPQFSAVFPSQFPRCCPEKGSEGGDWKKQGETRQTEEDRIIGGKRGVIVRRGLDFLKPVVVGVTVSRQ